MGDLNLQLTVILDSASLMAFLSSQPFMHSSRQKVPILYNGPFPKKLALPTGDLDPSNTLLLWLTRVHKPNGISIGSAVFAGFTAERP